MTGQDGIQGRLCKMTDGCDYDTKPRNPWPLQPSNLPEKFGRSRTLVHHINPNTTPKHSLPYHTDPKHSVPFFSCDFQMFIEVTNLETVFHIPEPWYIVDCVFDEQQKQLDVFVKFQKEATFPCSNCGAPNQQVYDIA
jgi:hypothetical protein